MRRQSLLVLFALAVAVAGAACGAKAKDEKASGASGPAATTPSGGNANTGNTKPGKPTTTTAPKPRTTIKHQPDCIAYEKYSLALSAVAFASPQKRAEVEKKADDVAANAKKALPQLASDIDTQLALTKKAATPGGLNQTEKDQLKKVGDNLTAWRKSTCL